MIKAIEVARKVSKNLDESSFLLLEEINLHNTFKEIWKLDMPVRDHNVIICFIIFSYDNDSSWLNLKQNRYDNKVKILSSLTKDYKSDFYESLLKNSNDELNEVIGNYLGEQPNWKWAQITHYLDFHSKMLRFVSQKTDTEKSIDKVIGKGEQQTVRTLTSDLDMDVVAKINKQKGDLLDQALEARKKADTLLSEIRKEFVQLDNAIQQDFGFEITSEKNIDILSWRQFIEDKNKRKKLQS